MIFITSCTWFRRGGLCDRGFRPSDTPEGILRRCCSRGHIRLDTAVHFWFGWMIRRTPRVPRAMPVRASYGPARESSMFFISYGTCTGPVRDPQGRRMTPFRTRKVIDTARIDKNPARASYLAVRSPHGLFMGCIGYQNPYGVRKLIMHASKLYGPRTGRHNSYGAARGPWVDVRFLFKTAREQPLRGPGVWCDWGKTLAQCMCQSSTPIRYMYNLHNILYKISYNSTSETCVEQKKSIQWNILEIFHGTSICQSFLNIKYIPILRNVPAVCPMFQ